MKKNVASQSIGAQMITAADGTAFTSAVTVYVTGDNGTQAIGSVGSGVCTHEGNGYHSYAPAQAETNYDHVAYTFIGTGAIPTTVEFYTEFPQSGDSFTRLGAPAGADISADIAAIEAQTDDIGTAGAGLTGIPWNSAWDAEVQSEVADALNAYDPPTRAELTADKDEILEAMGVNATTIATPASQTSFTLTAGSADDDAYNGWRAVVIDQSTNAQRAQGFVSDYTGSTKTVTLAADPGIFTMAVGDTIVLTPADVNVSGMDTDVISGGAMSAAAASKIFADIVETEGSITAQQVLSIALSVLAGETTNSGNTLQTPNGNATRVTATVASNERTAITLNPSAA